MLSTLATRGFPWRQRGFLFRRRAIQFSSVPAGQRSQFTEVPFQPASDHDSPKFRSSRPAITIHRSSVPAGQRSRFTEVPFQPASDHDSPKFCYRRRAIKIHRGSRMLFLFAIPFLWVDSRIKIYRLATGSHNTVWIQLPPFLLRHGEDKRFCPHLTTDHYLILCQSRLYSNSRTYKRWPSSH